MALTPSTMLDLETPLPPFSLPTVTGGSISNAELNEQPVLLMVICSHCPFVKHVDRNSPGWTTTSAIVCS